MTSGGSAFIELISAFGTETGPLSVSTTIVSPLSWTLPWSFVWSWSVTT
jgi:hypothetical protein